MPSHTVVFRVFIASPSDLEKERSQIISAIHQWNDQHSIQEGIVLLPVCWEENIWPQFTNRPQEPINTYLVDSSDAAIAVFGTRFGTPTGVAGSGTVEEIERFSSAGKPIMLYESTQLVDPASIDLEQLRKLREFKNETYNRAIVGRFDSSAELRRVMERDLSNLVRHLNVGGNVKYLHHVSVPVRDLDLSLQFYVKMLGLEVIERPTEYQFGGAWLRATPVSFPEQHIHLVTLDPKHNPSTKCGTCGAEGGAESCTFRVGKVVNARDIHFAIQVGSIVEITNRMKAVGEDSPLYRSEALRDTDFRKFRNNADINPGGYWQTYVHDPDGHIIELHEFRRLG
jgi:catechol 2,3-dioxygenase-like lactoylglutathione lyase family enzyme